MWRKTAGCTILHDDVECALAELPEGCAELVLCDPPFNFRQKYSGCDDHRSADAYLNWVRAWLGAAARATHPHGSLWLFIPDQWVSEVDVIAKHELGLHKRSHIVWCYTFGQASQTNFGRSHTHVIYYVRDRTRFTFNADEIRVPSARQAIYQDKRQRPGGKLPDDTWCLYKSELEPRFGNADRDTWVVSRICGTFKERRGCEHSPNQIPTQIWRRIILACSEPKYLVLDCFAGTANAGVVAIQLGRRYLGIDISERCVIEGRKRLSHARNERQQS
jgi:site-specific DNA-methyltransferase (adenine-specific)